MASSFTDPAVLSPFESNPKETFPFKPPQKKDFPNPLAIHTPDPPMSIEHTTHVIVVRSKDALSNGDIASVVGRSLQQHSRDNSDYDSDSSSASSRSHSDISSQFIFTEDFDEGNRRFSKRKTPEYEPRGVSKRFIRQCNTRVGNPEDTKKAKELICQMRQLANLEENSNCEIDIPSARLGLSMLIEINDQTIKMDALNSLLESLEKDQYDKATSPNLIQIASKLMKKMNKQLIQTQTVDVQIKMAQVYSALAFLIQRHYGKKSLNGITGKFKKDLISTAQALQNLNRLENPKLSFYVKCAIQGFLRLKDDRKELFELFERSYYILSGALALYFKDAQAAFPQIEKAFKNISFTMSNSWYDKTLIMKCLAKNTTEEKHVVFLLLFIRKYGESSNWKFTYACIETLYQLSLNHPNKHVRNRAFNGVKQFGEELPGLIKFTDTNNLKKYLDMGPVVHFQKPKIKNPNQVIRQTCLEFLRELEQDAPDEEIRNKAKTLISKNTPVGLKSSTEILLESYEKEDFGS